jgi:hypothetical protein
MQKTVSDLRRAVNDFKLSQNVGGSSIILYTSQTVDTWDVLNANINTAYDYAEWIVLFVPDIPETSYTEFGLDYLFHDTASGLEQIYYYLDPLIASSTGSQRYIVRCQNVFVPLQLNMKFQIRSTSPGSVSFVRSL